MSDPFLMTPVGHVRCDRAEAIDDDWDSVPARIELDTSVFKNRPNRLGATICEILSVDGTVLHLKGLDAIDGTPVLDIKPVMSGFQPRGALREPGWSKEIMETYW